MAERTNDFSWSFSRHESYRCCPRQYWFRYYGAWGGWDRHADPRARALYVLKQLDTRQSWMGSTVHKCLRWVLDTLRQQGAAPPEEQALQLLARRMNRDYQESGEGLYWEEPGKHAGLLEHEYDEREVTDEEWEAVMAKALTCLSTFYHSDVFRDLQALGPTDWLDVEEPASFDLAGTRAWVRLDCAYRQGGGAVLYDWKTGEANCAATREQPAGYILCTVQRWNLAPEQIVARAFNLAEGSQHETRLDTAQLAEVRATLAEAAAELKALHGAPEERFPFTEDETCCARCNFTRVCPRFANGPGA